jgi:hypothetical protein
VSKIAIKNDPVELAEYLRKNPWLVELVEAQREEAHDDLVRCQISIARGRAKLRTIYGKK